MGGNWGTVAAFIECLLYLRGFTSVNSLHPSANPARLCGRCYSPHLTNRKAKAQGGSLNALPKVAQLVTSEPGYQPGTT